MEQIYVDIIYSNKILIAKVSKSIGSLLVHDMKHIRHTMIESVTYVYSYKLGYERAICTTVRIIDVRPIPTEILIRARAYPSQIDEQFLFLQI